MVMGFAFLVHYLMQFPKEGAFLRKSWAKKLIYGPAILLALFFSAAAHQPSDLSPIMDYLTLASDTAYFHCLPPLPTATAYRHCLPPLPTATDSGRG